MINVLIAAINHLSDTGCNITIKVKPFLKALATILNFIPF